MNFCPNCGAELSGPVKFCSECGMNLQAAVSTAIPVVLVAQTPTQDQKSAQAFELLKGQLSAQAGTLAKDISQKLIERWKASGKYPKRFGGVVDQLVGRAVPPLVEMKVRSMPWKNETATDVGQGQMDTCVSTTFPLELETKIPLLGKIKLNEVKLTMKGMVDIGLGKVNQIGVGGLDLA